MAKFKNSAIPLWVVVGLVLLIAFIARTQFLGVLVTKCENVEPKSISGFIAAVNEANGTIDQSEPFSVIGEFALETYTTYTANDDIGTYEIILMQNISCSDLLAIVDQRVEGTAYTVAETRQVLLTDAGYMWCNNANNIALRTASLEVISGYADKFEVCITEDIPEEVPEEPVEEEDAGTRAIISSTPTPSPSPVIIAPTESRESISNEKLIRIGIFVLVVAIVFYFVYEKGPNKGFIRKRRRK